MSGGEPTGRELRLANAVIDLLSLVNSEFIPPGVILSDPLLMKLDELSECLDAYKRHMLKPRMRRHTQIVVRVSPIQNALDSATATERERCAKACDARVASHRTRMSEYPLDRAGCVADALEAGECAAAIRGGG